ncbi:hypothetical protein [uncultured Robinsoniella sp.]
MQMTGMNFQTRFSPSPHRS